MEHLSVDAVSIFHHMQHHEKELWHKRKFLMGLSDINFCDQDVRSPAGKQSTLPESFLRKDDVFYEDVKNFVERGFLQAFDTEARHSIADEEEEFCEVHNVSRTILTLLDDLSNNGLCRLVKIVTRGSVFFDKTRPQMIRHIKNSLQELHSNQLDNYQGQVQNQLSQLLKNPKNFRQNHGKHVKLTRNFFLSAFHKVQLESIPVRILGAMYRRLKGTQGVMPKLRPRPLGWNKRSLIEQVEKLWGKLIDRLDESDKPPDPLIKAMAVPGLYSKIAPNNQDLSMATFVHLSPEIEALQNEIVKAIWSLDHRFKKEELKRLQLILDPKSKVDVTGLRKAIRNMLIDCLFECSDMEVVPDSFLEALSLINKKSGNTCRFSSKEVIEEEVECVLNVGAHLKQFLWSCVSVDKLDQEFADAYMEELEESDDGDIFDEDDQKLLTNSMDEVQIRFNDFNEEVASTGEADHASFSSATPIYKDYSVKDEFVFSSSFSAPIFSTPKIFQDYSIKKECVDTKINGDEMHSTVAGDVSIPLFSPMLQGNGNILGRQDSPQTSKDLLNHTENCSKQNPMSVYQRNHYVAIQEVCDQASLVSYQLIGHILADFGQVEALGMNRDKESYLRGIRSEKFLEPVADSKDKDVSGSIIVQAVHKVIPSFPNSQLDVVKRFMSL